jgi:hypothetical protein
MNLRGWIEVREVTLVNSLCQLDAGNRDCGLVERFEPLHGGTAAFDCSVILLNDIVEVVAAPHLHVFPLRNLSSR